MNMHWGSTLEALGKHFGSTGDQQGFQEGKGREGKGIGKERELTSADSSSDESTPSAVILVFPITGKGPNTWNLTADYVQELSSDYPNIDVLAACRAARAWAVANPAKRKTAKGMQKFLVNWLNRAVNDGTAMPISRERSTVGQWRDECARLHGDSCGNQHFHAAKMALISSTTSK